MKHEKADYKTFRRGLYRYGDRIDRVENLVVAGMPDVNLASGGVELWIEFKSPIEPKRPRSPLFGGSNHQVLQTQANWFLEQCNAGGRCFLLVSTNKRWLLIPGAFVAHEPINKWTVSEFIMKAVWHCEKPARREQWETLRAILFRDSKQGQCNIRSDA